MNDFVSLAVQLIIIVALFAFAAWFAKRITTNPKDAPEIRRFKQIAIIIMIPATAIYFWLK
jgi:flagellar biogenesis protein FliO